MSRELDLLAKEFRDTPVSILRKNVNLYQSNIHTSMSSFLREIEKQCKTHKQSSLILIMIQPKR
jgi:hypothetical protein